MIRKIIFNREPPEALETYCAPKPTQDQLALGAVIGSDPYDRCGDSWTDMPACIAVAAACVIHDELYMLGGDEKDWLRANANFRRDAMILAHAQQNIAQRVLDKAMAVAFADIVDTFSEGFWHAEDYNTDVTRPQGAAQMLEAKKWVNRCALKIDTAIPYVTTCK